MTASIFRRLLRDRRGATAMILALMSVPMIIAAGAAVDFSRVASARAQLQYAVDEAALAGAGTYQTNQDGTKAYNVASTAFATAAASLGNYAAVTSTQGTDCNPSGATGITCGTTSTASGVVSLCPSTTVYCVEVTAQATLKNSLLGFIIPTDVLNVVSVAQSTGANLLDTGNFSHTGVGYGSDLDAVYAYAVPTDASGNPAFGNIPTPNSYCANSAYGPIQYQPTTAAASGVTSCNYVLIGTNSSNSGTGSLSFADTDPVAFSYTNFDGGTYSYTNEITDLDTTVFNSSTGVSTNTGLPTHYTNEIYVTYALLGVTTTKYYAQGTIISGITLWASCPAHNLYGSIEAYPNANAADDLVPYQDSINTFSSAWEMMGYPPTHATNHALLPFLGPPNGLTIAGTGYIIRAICPQWPTTGTTMATNPATATFTPGNLPSGYSPVASASGSFPTASNVPVYSTYYPDVTYSSTSGTYPPAIAGCTPATSALDGAVTPTAFNPWWGWSPPNNTDPDPGGAYADPGGGAVTDCTAARVSSGGGGITYTQNALQSARYNDCTFIIQPLGNAVPESNSVPELPDYYTYTESSTAFTAQTTGNANGVISLNAVPSGNLFNIVATESPVVIGMTPVYDGVGNGNATGYVPATVTVSGTGPYSVTEPPVNGSDHYPPEDTSHQCYNPQANGFNGSLLPNAAQPNNDSPITPVDPVENPEFGAVYCNVNPPPVYVMFWNDMGAYTTPARYNDDLGYGNAISEFTCPTPGNAGSTGPPALVY